MHAIQYFSPTPPSDPPPRNYDILNVDRREIEMSTIHRSTWKTGSSELWRNLSMSKLGELPAAAIIYLQGVMLLGSMDNKG